MCCRSPEATQLNGTSLQKHADIWALVCTILYMFTPTLPYEDMSLGNALQAGQIPAIPDSLPLDLQRMLHHCFTRPSTRSTAARLPSSFR